MKRSVAALLSAAAGVVLQVPAATADDVQLPLRKAGKWEQVTVMDEGGNKHEQTLTICIDADMERNTAVASGEEHKKSCSKYEVKKEGDKVVVDATCTMNSRDVESRTEMSGDFQNNFDIKITSNTSGIYNQQSVSVQRTIEQHGKYLGDSCGDLQAGEAMGSDGTKLLVQ